MSDDRVADVEQALQAEGIKLETPVSKELSAFEAEQAAKGWDPNGEKSAEEWHRAAPLYNELKERQNLLDNDSLQIHLEGIFQT